MRTAMAGSMMMASALAMATPELAVAFDITGNWTGKWKCSGISSGEKSKTSNGDSTAAITQDGSVFGAVIDGELDYVGIAVADGGNADKGAVGVVHCGTSDDLVTSPSFSELGNWKVSTKGDKGTLSGVTVWSNGPQHIATCKYKYKRANTTDPAVATSCP